jgi:hypothetical protein
LHADTPAADEQRQRGQRADASASSGGIKLTAVPGRPGGEVGHQQMLKPPALPGLHDDRQSAYGCGNPQVLQRLWTDRLPT